MKESAVSLITRLDGHLLCVWNAKQGGWVLPGGKVEKGEEPIVAASRELHEETSLITLFSAHVYEGPSATDPERVVHVYVVGAYGEPREVEVGKPVTWLTPLKLVTHSPFSPFYTKMFTAIGGGEPKGERNTRERSL